MINNTHFSGRNPVCRIETLEIKEQLMIIGRKRGDDWGLEVLGRLEGINDLVAEEACYHKSCRSTFDYKPQQSGKGRPADRRKQEIYDKFRVWFDSCKLEDSMYTIDQLHEIMVTEFSDGEEVFTRRYFKNILLKDYWDTLYVTNQERKMDVVCLKDKVNEILREHHAQSNDEGEDMLIIKTAACLIKNKIKTMKIDKGNYPSLEEMKKCSQYVPEELKYFLSFFIENEELQDVWGQNFVKALRPKSGVMPFQLALAIQMDHKFASKWLVDRLHYLKVCESYKELLNFKWCHMKRLVLKEITENPPTLRPTQQQSDDVSDQPAGESNSEKSVACSTAKSTQSQDEGDLDTVYVSLEEDLDTTLTSQVSSNSHSHSSDEGNPNKNPTEKNHEELQVAEPYERKGEQFVADNVDIPMTSPYGLRSVHAMGRIRVIPASNYKSQDQTNKTERRLVPTTEKVKILKDLDIKIECYYPNKKDGFTSIKFIPIKDLLDKIGKQKHCPGDLSWLLGWIVKKELYEDPSLFSHSNWKGFMKSIHKSDGADKSVIQFLTVVDNPPDNYNTVYTTLLECMRVAVDNPMIITFDLPLWTKATRIILERDLPIIPRLGGFHQLMSYTGSMGYLMTGSGIEDCFKIIYPNFPVDKLLSGKSHYKTVRAHLLIDAALFVYMMDGTISSDELEKSYGYILDRKEDKDGAYVDTQFMTEIVARVNDRLGGIEKRGKTQKLWLQYHDHVQIMRSYIRAERTSDADLYLKCSALMLPIVMAAGHGQYGKALRYTLQQSLRYEGQVKAFFLTAKQHTVSYSCHSWSGIWSDLSIEQTLMRYCKSIGGLSGGRLRNESAKKVWILTLASFSQVRKSF